MTKILLAITFFVVGLTSCETRQDTKKKKETIIYNMALFKQARGPVRSVTRERYSDVSFILGKWRPGESCRYDKTNEVFSTDGLLLHSSGFTAAPGIDTSFYSCDLTHTFSDTGVISIEKDNIKHCSYTWYRTKINDSTWWSKRVDSTGFVTYEEILVFNKNGFNVKNEGTAYTYNIEGDSVEIIDHSIQHFTFDNDMNMKEETNIYSTFNYTSKVVIESIKKDKHNNATETVAIDENGRRSIQYKTYEYYK